MLQRLNGALDKVIKNSQPAIRRERGKGGKIVKDWSLAPVNVQHRWNSNRISGWLVG
jgi:hypothetical protein